MHYNDTHVLLLAEKLKQPVTGLEYKVTPQAVSIHAPKLATSEGEIVKSILGKGHNLVQLAAAKALKAFGATEAQIKTLTPALANLPLPNPSEVIKVGSGTFTFSSGPVKSVPSPDFTPEQAGRFAKAYLGILDELLKTKSRKFPDKLINPEPPATPHAVFMMRPPELSLTHELDKNLLYHFKWEALRRVYQAEGALVISTYDYKPGGRSPVYTCDPVIPVGDKLLLHHRLSAAGEPTEGYYGNEQTAILLGILASERFGSYTRNIKTLIHEVPIDGGNVVYDRSTNTIFYGYDPHNNTAYSHVLQIPDKLKQLTGKDTVPVGMIDRRFYHLDTCVNFLPGGEMVICPNAFTATHFEPFERNRSYRLLREFTRRHTKPVVEISVESGLNFGTNFVNVGSRTVVLTTDDDELKQKFSKLGYRGVSPSTYELDIGSFSPGIDNVKASPDKPQNYHGGARCMTLDLSGLPLKILQPEVRGI